MDQKTIQILFALLRSVICGQPLSQEEWEACSQERLQQLFALTQKHDLAHLAALGMKNNGLGLGDGGELKSSILNAAYRYEQLNYQYERTCATLEKAGIPFLPLKGSVLRAHYPEPWMRTSCDIDILVHPEDMDAAAGCLMQELQYEEKKHCSHEVTLVGPGGGPVELHFDLVEDRWANNANGVLDAVWEHVSLRENWGFCYDMDYAMFYFYHIAHMAKHFETGGCGIRPFMDLWIMDRMAGADPAGRDELLEQGGLLRFAQAARRLSEVWFGQAETDPVSAQMENFILRGGVYGTTTNRIALQQQQKGGRFGYVLSRIFMPYNVIKCYFPVLQKHRWLTPFVEVYRWVRMVFCGRTKRSLDELRLNYSISDRTTDDMKKLLSAVGL